MRTPTLLALVLVLALGACEGKPCDGSASCPGSLECAGPNDPQACGIPAMEQCSSDADCIDGGVCHAIPDACSPDGIGSECRLACTDGNCGEGFRCAASGACEAIPCDEGFVCDDHLACDPEAARTGPVHARAHGCVTIACSDDDACAMVSGTCVNGFCQDGPGSCVAPELVP